MLSERNTKNANYLYLMSVLRSIRDGGTITQKEYLRAKNYYQALTGSDLVIAD